MYVFYVGFLNFDIFHVVAIASYRSFHTLRIWIGIQTNFFHIEIGTLAKKPLLPIKIIRHWHWRIISIAKILKVSKDLHRQWTIDISIGETWLNAHLKVESQFSYSSQYQYQNWRTLVCFLFSAESSLAVQRWLVQWRSHCELWAEGDRIFLPFQQYPLLTESKIFSKIYSDSEPLASKDWWYESSRLSTNEK